MILLHSPRIFDSDALPSPSISFATRVFCVAVVDYDAMRKDMAAVFEGKIQVVRGLVTKLQKTQRAAEQTLEKYIWK